MLSLNPSVNINRCDIVTQISSFQSVFMNRNNLSVVLAIAVSNEPYLACVYYNNKIIHDNNDNNT